MNPIASLRLSTLAAAILAAIGIAPAARAATIDVDAVLCSLPNAIRSANTDTAVGACTAGNGADTLRIPAGYTYATNVELPAILSDVTITSAFGGTATLNNEGSRLFFIGGEGSGGTVAPNVSFNNINLTGSIAKGGTGVGGGAGGAGAGAGIFVHAGNVTITNVGFSFLAAIGGTGSNATPGSNRGGGGGGGLGGSGGNGGNDTNGAPGTASNGQGPVFGGGGGGGGDFVASPGGNSSPGGNGGHGGVATDGSLGANTGGFGGESGSGNAQAGGFGGGGGGASAATGNSLLGFDGAGGGFGGGGGGGGSAYANVAGAGGDGGFGGGGGGGGVAYANGSSGGDGGFGGGGGSVGAGEGSMAGTGGAAGFGGGASYTGPFTIGGASGGGGAFGGAIFVRSGTVTIIGSNFNSNSASGGAGGTSAGAGQGKGGAIFALDSLVPPNGNAQGYPAVLPKVSGCNNTFAGNSASSGGAGDRDNADTYGTSKAQLASNACDRIFADGFEG